MDIGINNPIGWYDDITDAILDDKTSSAYASFINGYERSGASYSSDKFEPVLDAFVSAATSMLAKIADQVADGALDDAIDASINVTTNANGVRQTGPLGNLYSYTVNQTVDGVDVDVTMEFLFEGLSGGPAGAAPVGGPTTLKLDDLHVNISGSAKRGDVSMAFAAAPSGDHILGTISASIPPASRSNDPINISAEGLEVNVPVTLKDSDYSFDANVVLDLAVGLFDLKLGSGGSSSSVETSFMADFKADVEIEVVSGADRLESAVKFDSNKTNATPTMLAWGGGVDGFELRNESGSDFLAVAATLEFSAMVSGNSVEIDMKQERVSATEDEISDTTVKSGGDTVTINRLVRSSDGDVVDLDAVKSSTGERASASGGDIKVD